MNAAYACDNPVFHTKMKHLAHAYFFAKENVNEGQLQVKHVSTAQQQADSLTKSLSRSIFHYMLSRLV